MAKATGFMFVSGDQFVMDMIHDGFLKPGQTVHVMTEMPPDDQDQPKGVVFCRDVRERSYTWNLKGERKEMKRSRRKPFHAAYEMWAAHYPDVDLKTLTQVSCAVQLPELTL